MPKRKPQDMTNFGFYLPKEGLADFSEVGFSEFTCCVLTIDGEVIAAAVISKHGYRDYWCRISDYTRTPQNECKETTFGETTLRNAMRRTTKKLKKVTKGIPTQPFSY